MSVQKDRPRFRSFITFTAFIVGISYCFEGVLKQSQAEESHPGISNEALYMEAVLAFNKKDFNKALQILDQILKAKPDNVEALEVKALALKTKGDDKNSLDVYNKLIRLKPLKERGPYYFEAAVIYNRQKKLKEAAEFFKKAIELNFNTVAASLFLGLIEFNRAEMEEALKLFQKVKSDGSPDLQVVAMYYIGLIYFKMGAGPQGTAEMLEVRDAARKIPDNKMVKDIGEGAGKILAPFTNGTTFANITTLTQYDTNILQQSISTVGNNLTSGKKAPKVMLMGGFGRMTAPLNTIQWIPSYRFSVNRNFADDAHAYEFFTNTASMYFNYRPLAQTTGGVKVDGNFLFQNQGVGSSLLFRKYSLTGELGPFIKFKIGSWLKTDIETYVKPLKVFESADQSGLAYLGRLTFKIETGTSFFNPTFVGSYEKSAVPGADSQSQTTSFALSNPFKMPWGITFSPSADLSNITYPLSSSSRADKLLNVRLSVLKSFPKNWTVMADATLTRNTSNVADNVYNRAVFGLGLTKGF